MKTSKLTFLVAVFGLIIMAASSAHAFLAAVGPVKPTTGFPKWYMDTNGVKVGLCKNPFFCFIDPTGVEQFYYGADAVIAVSAGMRDYEVRDERREARFYLPPPGRE
jgi:hypothetical protein